jgi:Uma2 family endonuclease
MTLASNKAKFTPEDLLTMPDAVSYELVDGNLVERKMGTESSMIAVAIATILTNFVKGKKLGFIAGADCGYQCFRDDPNKLRKPDVSFIRAGRLPNNRPPKGHTKIAPDLAVEVLSPGDLVSEVDEKIEDYLGAGVKLIWVVSPETKKVRIHRPTGAAAGPISVLSDSETISGEDVLPGFGCRVGEFFEI